MKKHPQVEVNGIKYELTQGTRGILSQYDVRQDGKHTFQFLRELAAILDG
jgi:hypothetical protein